ncbi:MAG: NAD(P)/FAD-dependent oxidoreductase [Actinomycetota bacterium]|nr:NAD(P)/FAD-dependent oxidoreductase [Actinomycetota bacterium]
MSEPALPSSTRVAIVGSGFSGLGLAIALQRKGIDHVVLERRGDLGGTWRDNSYPGCKCDVPSHLYSYSFALNPNWSHTYSSQPEIFDYLRDCAAHFGVTPKIHFNTEVTGAQWDDKAKHWAIETSNGPLTADVLVAANGGLAEPAQPDFPGIDSFEGAVFHSANWNSSHELRGRPVAVIGTGATAVQIVPSIQPEVEHLTLFQRTPGWVLPHTDRPTTRFERALYRRVPALQKLVRHSIYWAREMLVFGMTKDQRFLKPIRKIATAHLHKQVKDPELRAKLTPRFSPGCKRLLLSNDYYRSLTAPNADVVTEPIDQISPGGIITADGIKHEVDTIVMATGFRVTDNPAHGRIKDHKGRSLLEAGKEGGFQAYKGTSIAGFPNLFVLTGPNTGIGHTSLLVMVEAQIPYIVDALSFMEDKGAAAIEVRADRQQRFNKNLQKRMKRTVWNAGGCSSWYLDDKGRNVTMWPDFTWKYKLMMRRFDPDAYRIERKSV